LTLIKSENEYALKVADQVHIHLPASAFTNEASNFWFGALLGTLFAAAVLTSLANQ